MAGQLINSMTYIHTCIYMTLYKSFLPVLCSQDVVALSLSEDWPFMAIRSDI